MTKRGDLLTKKAIISCDKISSKQWSVLLIELNSMKEAWKSFAKINIDTPDFEKTVRWGKRKHSEKEDQ